MLDELKVFWRNLTKSTKIWLFGVPAIIVGILVLLEMTTAITIYFSSELLITAFSILLVTNITALFSIPQETLCELYKNNKTRYGDSLYRIFMSRYAFTIYLCFGLVALLVITSWIQIHKYMLFEYKYTQWLRFGVMYVSISILFQNISLLKYYFLSLRKTIDKKTNETHQLD